MLTQDAPTSRPRRTGPLDRRARAAAHGDLEELIRLLEVNMPAMVGSVLLLDEDGHTLRHGAAPSLPSGYTSLIDGSFIGPAAGSCGTAVWRREQVIVRDIQNDPLWESYRHMALPYGLRACWSTLIVDPAGAVLGTFAMYYHTLREPSRRELEMTHIAARLACNILVRARAEDTLRENAALMREARETAEHANQKKAEFLAKMSHELRTPLNAIGGYASLILDGIPEPVPDAHQASLHRILKAQQHLLGLIETVLTHAKLEAGQMTYELDDVPMGEILDVVESLTSPQVSAKSLIYACHCDRSILLRCDQQKVVQILLNLISNAVKFTPMTGRITVRTAVQSQGEVVIGVADTGIGMTSEQVSTVFEPFTQFDTQLTSQDHGTGLGMPISRELARGMGGELTVESHPGTGTEFLLRLSTSVPRQRPSSGVPSESRV